ncbi:MAG TPA: aminoacyl-tRNA hydrolase [Thermoplasmata archaeon]|nr:aminoacyl-tRNA hydrolase [Thermoplasmata archaeon]
MPGEPRRGSGGWKVALVIRGELRLTAGKAAVQAAHAAVLLYERARTRAPGALEEWSRGGQRKIALLAPTLAEMEALERAARGRGIATVWVEDAGFTEVAPGTRTCLGLGPARDAELDPITGTLELL